MHRTNTNQNFLISQKQKERKYETFSSLDYSKPFKEPFPLGDNWGEVFTTLLLFVANNTALYILSSSRPLLSFLSFSAGSNNNLERLMMQ